MPKIRDLGINVIPETMRPPEIGQGGGGGCGQWTFNLEYTTCPTGSARQSETTCYNDYAAMPWTCPTGTGGPRPTEGCNYNYAAMPWTCPTGTGGPRPTDTCAYYQQVPGCPTGTATRPTENCVPPHCPGGTYHPQPQPVLTREAIEQLKQQLHQQIAQLDEYAKSIGPKTIEEIDAREKQIREELEELARRREQYQKKE